MEASTLKASATFVGGVHPADNKGLSTHKPTVTAAIPKRVVIPLSEHIGAPTKPLVVIGQEVKKGEKIGESGGFVPTHPGDRQVFLTVGKAARFPCGGSRAAGRVRVHTGERGSYEKEKRNIPGTKSNHLLRRRNH